MLFKVSESQSSTIKLSQLYCIYSFHQTNYLHVTYKILGSGQIFPVVNYLTNMTCHDQQGNLLWRFFFFSIVGANQFQDKFSFIHTYWTARAHSNKFPKKTKKSKLR